MACRDLNRPGGNHALHHRPRPRRHRWMWAVVIATTSLCSGATRAERTAGTANIKSTPLQTRTRDGDLLFRRLDAGRTGIDFLSPLDYDHERCQLYLHGFAASGICIGDVDKDGLPDIYLVGNTGTNKLYRNIGDFRFEDVTERAGVSGGDNWGAGATFVDIDNDGDLDLYVCNYDAPNLLYINRGDGTFVESASDWGIDYHGASIMASFADMDNDGDLDFYLLTNRIYSPIGRTRQPRINRVDGQLVLEPGFEETHAIQTRLIGGEKQKFIVQAGQSDHLYRNNSDGSFTEVTEQAGISGNHPGLSATWWDFDNDGWMDIYVGNDYWDPDYLYRNNGDGTFTDVLGSTLPHTTWFSMGADTADINNDGLVDLLVGDMSSTTHFMQKISMGDMSEFKWFLESAEPRQYMRNTLFLNTGSDRFMEIARLAGLASTDWTWSIKFGDLDNDGWIDVFFTNGTINQSLNPDFAKKQDIVTRKSQLKRLTPQEHDSAQWNLYRKEPPRRESNLAFRNLRNLRFERVEQRWGLGDVGLSYAAAYSDLDRDGDLDVVVGNLDEPVGIYRNNGTSGHRVLIRLRGGVSNRFGIGALVTIESNSTTQVRRLTAAQGFMSSNEPLVHFGLGEDQTISRLHVEWPSGRWQTFENLLADRFYEITEPSAPPDAARSIDVETHATLRFREVSESIGLTGSHHEKPFDDFRRQPLLPNKLSQLGPGMAWGDADGDGDEDLFVAGSAGYAGVLYLRQGDGHFVRQTAGPWLDDYRCEDMAPLWLDADVDGDMDLYVTSGSVEVDQGDALLRDRLYLNDGSGGFSRAPADMLPEAADSTAVVVAADFDRDGDLDLFVGGRVIPGRYPLAPSSRLLRNDRDRFVDVTDTAAPGLRRVGLVTGALWSDVDDDGLLDLLITLEWGAVRFWRNNGSAFEDRTAAAGLADNTGWWNGIAAGDFDLDGDIDYIATNFGLNTKYHADPDHPTRLYYGDLDGTGHMRIIEAEFEEETLFPVRGRSCSANAMPFIRERFPTFASFARAELDAIYSAHSLSDAKMFEAVRLESVMLLNRGNARFLTKPLPTWAQASPGFGVVVTDFDGDTNPDVFIAQNFFSAQVETGRMDGGLGALLRGTGDGGLLPVSPAESGLIVSGDAMSATVCDFNEDARPDLVVAQNNGPLLAFQNLAPAQSEDRRPFYIKLQGHRGNPCAVGARVTLVLDNGKRQTAEIYAGSGYLSQSTSGLFFGMGADNAPNRVEVRWPDGRQTSHAAGAAQYPFIIVQPSD